MERAIGEDESERTTNPKFQALAITDFIYLFKKHVKSLLRQKMLTWRRLLKF